MMHWIQRPRPIAAAASMWSMHKLPMVLRRRTISLHKYPPPRDHSQVIRWPHAKSGPDLLNTVAGHKEHINRTN